MDDEAGAIPVFAERQRPTPMISQASLPPFHPLIPVSPIPPLSTHNDMRQSGMTAVGGWREGGGGGDGGGERGRYDIIGARRGRSASIGRSPVPGRGLVAGGGDREGDGRRAAGARRRRASSARAPSTSPASSRRQRASWTRAPSASAVHIVNPSQQGESLEEVDSRRGTHGAAVDGTDSGRGRGSPAPTSAYMRAATSHACGCSYVADQ